MKLSATVLLILVALAQTTCSGSSRNPPSIPPDQSTTTLQPTPLASVRQSTDSHQNSNSSFLPGQAIRAVDFGNLTYEWFPGWAINSRDGKKIILRDGEMHADDVKPPFEVSLLETDYGDLTGDGSEEAIVVLDLSTSGSRNRAVFVYGMRDGNPILIFVREAGARENGGLLSAYLEGGRLVMVQNKPTVIGRKGKSYELPSVTSSCDFSYFKWDGKKVVKDRTLVAPCDVVTKSP